MASISSGAGQELHLETVEPGTQNGAVQRTNDSSSTVHPHDLQDVRDGPNEFSCEASSRFSTSSIPSDTDNSDSLPQPQDSSLTGTVTECDSAVMVGGETIHQLSPSDGFPEKPRRFFEEVLAELAEGEKDEGPGEGTDTTET